MKERGFKGYLKSRGLKFTKERQLILNEINLQHRHFDLDEFYLKMRQKGLKVSKASVYRILPLLLESGLIKQVEKTDKHAHYELISGSRHHDHMLCLLCGRIIEFYSPKLEELQDRLCKDKDFEGMSHTLEIMGYCKGCRDKR